MTFPQHSFLNIKFLITLTAIITALALMSLTIALFNLKKAKITYSYNPSPLQPKKPSLVVTSQDIKAIAGENIMSTQLDLARAYIEMDKKNMAKKILDHVIKNGDKSQQNEAQQLMTALKL